MYGATVRQAALDLLATGRSCRSVSIELGVSRAALRDWAARPERAVARNIDHRCWRCSNTECTVPVPYAYLLGQYLGDGYLVTSARVPHWPCVLPQHGPGAKHTRPIVLADWQRELVAEHPWPLIRGLIHSDGCRSLNRVTIKGKTYSYPRYFLSNMSRDILAIMGDALDSVGVAWRYNRFNSISIARRDAVAVMDHHVGPKC